MFRNMDTSVIENIAKNFSSDIKIYTVEELEARIQKSEQDIRAGRVHTTDEVRKDLGL